MIEGIPEFESPPRNLIFHSEGLMLSGALDAIKQRDGEWIPFEAKKSSAPDSQRPQHWHGFMLTPGAWYNDQLQVIGQMYISQGKRLFMFQGINLLQRKPYSCSDKME